MSRVLASFCSRSGSGGRLWANIVLGLGCSCTRWTRSLDAEAGLSREEVARLSGRTRRRDGGKREETMGWKVEGTRIDFQVCNLHFCMFVVIFLRLESRASLLKRTKLGQQPKRTKESSRASFLPPPIAFSTSSSPR